MTRVVSELIVSLDLCARGTRSPGYYGYFGPAFAQHLKARNDEAHRKILGRKTYEMLQSIPPEARDDGWRAMTTQPGWLFSRTLTGSAWPGLALVRDDVVEAVRRQKADGGPDLRVLGSLSIVRQLARARVLDQLRLYVCPLVVPESGLEPVFQEWSDTAFQLQHHAVLDDRILVLDYALAGAPPQA